MFPLHHVRSISSDARFVEHDELKFSLRSAYINLPWIHHIYIVTNGQVPSWLDTTHPKITMVNHREIMPASALPTFNSEAIQANIGNIEPLSEFFIYADDDFFFVRPVEPQFWFTEDGKTIIRTVRDEISENDARYNVYFGNIKYSSTMMRTKYPDAPGYETVHNSIPYRKSCYVNCTTEFWDLYNTTTHRKFRSRESMQRTMMTYYAVVKGLGSAFHQSSVGLKESLYLPVARPEIMRHRLNEANPKILCINDHDSASEYDREHLKEFLQSLFPLVPEWEKWDRT